MTRYQLAWDDTRTGRLRPADDESRRPLAWLRVSWGLGHEVARVNVYGDGTQVSDRVWLAGSESIKGAVVFCDANVVSLRLRQSSKSLLAELGDPWEHHSVIDLP